MSGCALRLDDIEVVKQRLHVGSHLLFLIARQEA